MRPEATRRLFGPNNDGGEQMAPVVPLLHATTRHYAPENGLPFSRIANCRNR